jgi:hypothetical protein
LTQFNSPPYPRPGQTAHYVQADPYAGQGAGGNLKMCRTAAVVQIVVGACISLMAFCVLALGAVVAMAGDALPAEQQAELSELTSQFGDWAGVIFVITGICIGLPGLGQIALGLFVWRGSKASLIISMLLAGLFGGLSLVNLAALALGGVPANPAGACLDVLMLAVAIGLAVLLVMAYREAASLKAAWTAYEAQWQSYYQQQYQYQLALQQRAGDRQAQADRSAAGAAPEGSPPGQTGNEAPLPPPPPSSAPPAPQGE